MKMKKNKLTNFLKTGIFLFVFIFLIKGCQTNEDIIIPKIENIKPTIDKLTLDNAKNIPDFLELTNSFKINNFIDKVTVKNQIQNNNLSKTSEDNVTINNEEFNRFKKGDYVSYTFEINKNLNKDKNFFQNLVIEKKNGEIRGYIIKYQDPIYIKSGNNLFLRAKIFKSDYRKDILSLLEQIENPLQFKMENPDCGWERVASLKVCSVHGTHNSGNAACGNYGSDDYNYSSVYTCSGGGGVNYEEDYNIDNSYTGSGGGSSNSEPSNSVITLTNTARHLGNFFSYNDALSNVPLTFNSLETQISYLNEVGKFLNSTSFKELGQNLYEISLQQQNLNQRDACLMVSKTVEILNLIKNVSSFDQLSLNDQKIVATNSLFLSFLPNVSSIIGDYWPKTAEEWAVINDLIKQFLPELILGFVPGSSTLDVVSGINKGDATTVTLGIAGILVDAFGGSIFKGIGKASKVSYKVFKSFKIIHKFFRAVSYAIKTGLKTKLVDDIVYLTNSAGKNVAKITDDVVEIITDAGLKLINPSALKKLEKIIPTSSGYINSTKLGKAKRFKPSESGLKADFDNLKNLDNNQLGLQSETLANKLFKQDDYLAYDSKIPGFNGNNGFDGVYIKKDASGNVTDIIINEVKQVNSGSISLSPANTATGLPRQMTDEWIDNVIERMLQPNTSQQIKDLAQVIKNAKNQGKVTKVITGIDKVNNQILVFPIN